MDGFPGFAFPDDGGFTLISNSDGGDVRARIGGKRSKRIGNGELRHFPDFLCVVLYPAGARIVLCKFAISLRHDVAVRIHQEDGGAGGALVHRENVGRIRHFGGS